MAPRYVRVIAAAGAALAILSGCAAPAAQTVAASTNPATPAATGVPYSLPTHCGISEARVNNTFFVADQPLTDGQGNPPAGWGNPYQAGTITVSGSTAIFHDDNGHTVTFHERPGATGFLKTCS
jgi:hypothetical protein